MYKGILSGSHKTLSLWKLSIRSRPRKILLSEVGYTCIYRTLWEVQKLNVLFLLWLLLLQSSPTKLMSSWQKLRGYRLQSGSRILITWQWTLCMEWIMN